MSRVREELEFQLSICEGQVASNAEAIIYIMLPHVPDDVLEAIVEALWSDNPEERLGAMIPEEEVERG